MVDHASESLTALRVLQKMGSMRGLMRACGIGCLAPIETFKVSIDARVGGQFLIRESSGRY